MNEKSIFAAALERKGADERHAFLDEACAGNAELRAQVEELLRADVDAGSFLHHPPAGIDVTTGTIIDGCDTADSDSASAALPLLAPCDKPDRIGKLVGKVGEYEIIEIVGQGGMGTVLRAFDTKLSRVVAVKVMAPELAANPTAVRRFLREATTAAAVVHDHVITIHAVDDSHRPPFLVMEYIDGQTLQQKIDREGALQLKTILRIGSQAAAGLAAAHNTGLIHRDVKPGNILLENGVERVKITDFGLARAADDLEMTKAGMIAGTPQYMSPEQAKGEPIDTRSDLFSLGSVLWTMCTGRPAFRAETTMSVLKRVCEDEPRPIHEVNPEIPPWLEAIVNKLLAKDPDDRFQSAAEVVELLNQYLAHVQQPSLVPQPAPILGGRGSRRAGEREGSAPRGASHSRRWLMAAAALLLLCTGLSLAETTGVTNVAATVIRIVRGDGTLVVEIDPNIDPNIQVLVDGEELVITGAGPKEIRLRPGRHEVHAMRDGKRVETMLVSIARGGRAFVNVKLEREQPTPAGPITRQVLAGAVSRNGTVSPEGKNISYVDWNIGDVGIYELATGTNRRLLNQGYPEFSESSVFSPDSQQVAYSWFNKDYVWEVRIVGLDGSGPRVLYANKEKEVAYLQVKDWSADGKYILANFSRPDQIVLISVVDGSVRILKTQDMWWETMSLAPDGRYVVYSARPQKTSRHRDIFLLATDGSGEVPLVKHPADDTLLGWAPDGKRVVFASDRSGSVGVWLITVADGKPQGAPELVKGEIGQHDPMGLTRSGAFYYALSSGGQNVYSATLDLETGKVLTPPTVAIQRTEGFNLSPAWSPDGNYLACLSSRREMAPLIYIRSAETNEVRELAPSIRGFNGNRLSWSPDGRALLLAGINEEGERGVLQVDVQTGAVTTLVHRASNPFWSPDAKSLFFRRSGLRRKLIRRDMETGVEQVLYEHGPATAGHYTLSPDGSLLAFAELGALKLMPATGGEPRELLKAERPIKVPACTVAWTPDGQFLFFGRPNDKGAAELWRVPITGGEPQKLDLAMSAPLEHLRIHPDGRQITFNAKAQADKTEVWALENFLPPLKEEQGSERPSANAIEKP